MHIWVDADACPGVIKEILYRVAERTRLPLTLVANQWLKTPPYPSIRSIQVPKGFDVADNHIVDQVQAGDLVITADIPLAAAIIDKGALTEHDFSKVTIDPLNHWKVLDESYGIKPGPAPIDEIEFPFGDNDKICLHYENNSRLCSRFGLGFYTKILYPLIKK